MLCLIHFMFQNQTLTAWRLLLKRKGKSVPEVVVRLSKRTTKASYSTGSYCFPKYAMFRILFNCGSFRNMILGANGLCFLTMAVIGRSYAAFDIAMFIISAISYIGCFQFMR